ncbi:hypothetical protein I551_1500 [Mycobacterium ulcerans str. Harvey]|uniref:Amidohydrolase family protein n=1 Tax=Mycobacterium ulcerans str. Harvey TaxID=1299332 RepID=A0ABN0R4G5_MYCUL|nr:hypothetical protein I551_1500 [Mycobacterium ulcerans str. Harvey]
MTGDADAIYTNGDIVTVDDEQPIAEAVAVKDGRIVAVGAHDDVVRENLGRTHGASILPEIPCYRDSSTRTATTSMH